MLPLALLALPLALAQSPTPLAIPAAPPPSVPSIPENFLGLSLELSSLSYYLGSAGPSSIPSPFRLFMGRIAAPLSPSAPLRLRIGGNSMDDSLYVANQTDPPMLLVLDPDANDNDIPVSFGPLLFQSLSALVTSKLNISYSLGLSLRTPNDSSSFLPLAHACETLLPAGSLDLLMLGNEPDLYFSHGDRPGYANYTVEDYESDFAEEIDVMGTLVDYPILGGPSICCDWSLLPILQASYISLFSTSLKALTLQHYPQNNCEGTPPFPLSYYLSHSNVVSLSQWQLDGVTYALSQSPAVPVRMTEFNTASCGGVPGISDTFGATLWTLDYALQLASVGYAGAHIHTREPGVSYNVLQPPNTTDAKQLNSSWAAGTTYWPLVVLADALGGLGSTTVVDLNLTDDAGAGYALYPSSTSQVSRVVLINFSSANASYTLPFTNTQLETRFLLAPDTSSTSPPISWAGQTASSAGDGSFIGSETAIESVCAATGEAGCVIDVPGPGAAVVFLSAGTTITVQPTFTVDASGLTGTITTTTAGVGSSPTAGAASSASGAMLSKGRSKLVALLVLCAWFV